MDGWMDGREMEERVMDAWERANAQESDDWLLWNFCDQEDEPPPLKEAAPPRPRPVRRVRVSRYVDSTSLAW